MTEIVPNQLLSRYSRVYPALWDQVAEFLKRKSNKEIDWPSWCFLPLSGAAAIVQAEGERQGIPWEQTVADVGNLGALIAWRQSKGVYCFDPTMYDALVATPLEGTIPVDVLFHLPEWCVWIETPDGLEMDSPGFFAYLEHDVNTGAAELRISIALGNALTTQVLHLNKPTIAEAYAAGIEQGQRMAAQIGKPLDGLTGDSVKQISRAMARALAPRISLVLYLCTVNSEIRDEKTGTKRPANPAPVPTRKGPKLFAASTPTHWEVGWRVGAAIRAARDRERTAPQGGTHASPRAHVRKAHWHTFLIGAGRQTPVLKWLPPMPVGAQGEELPTVRRDVD